MNSHLLKTSIKSVLQEFGFKSKGSSFKLLCSDVILVITLRKSTHGNYYYMDCGINLRPLAVNEVVKAGDCHIQFNFNLLAEENIDIIIKALDITSSHDEDVGNLICLIRDKCLPKFIRMSSVAEIINMYKTHQIKAALILKNAREFLESN